MAQPDRRFAVAALAATLALAVGAAVPCEAGLFGRGAPYERGEKVVVTGVATDAQGLPLAGLRVRLEGWRSEFSLARLGRVRRDPTRIATETDAEGQFTLEWPWHEFYNRFELALGLMVREAEGETFQLLEAVDLSRKIKDGSPVVQSLAVADRGPIDRYRALLASIGSDDQRRLFEQLGRPDRVDEIELPDRLEVTWWYFRSGKAYRFEDGRLEQVIPFDPVTSF